MQCKSCGHVNFSDALFCSDCGEALDTETEVGEDVGVFMAYGHGWQQLWKHFLFLLLISVVFGLISAPSSVLGSVGQESGGVAAAVLGLFSVAYAVLISNPLGYGVAFVFLKAVRDEPLDVKYMFDGFGDYWNVVLANILVTVIVTIGFVMLIVPGIIFACRLAFTPYLVMDRKMLFIPAIQESWRMTRGYTWNVFGLALLAIPISIAGLICLGVGIIVSIMWVSLAFASLYVAISRIDPEAIDE